MSDERPQIGDVWYRIEDGGSENWTREFRVEKVTPCGVWLSDGFGLRRLVLEHARKRYACPTMADAVESFTMRKKRQLKLLRAQAERVERALAEIQSGAPRDPFRFTDDMETSR